MYTPEYSVFMLLWGPTYAFSSFFTQHAVKMLILRGIHVVAHEYMFVHA
jgi:hypothetical protein